MAKMKTFGAILGRGAPLDSPIALAVLSTNFPRGSIGGDFWGGNNLPAVVEI